MKKTVDVKDLLFALSDIMSVSGCEYLGHDKLTELLMPYFDEYEVDNTGNYIFIKRCERENAKRIMIDCHFDEVGMVVTDIHDGGFLTVSNIGGIDRGILPAKEVKIYGEKTIFGVVCSTPPHLQKPGDSEKVPQLSDIRIDTGYEKEKLEKIVKIGTPIGFEGDCVELLNGRLCGRGFDDKACIAFAVKGISMCKKKDLCGDVYLVVSAREEVAGEGAMLASYKVKPDVAFVADVNFARTPGTKNVDTIEYRKGAGITLTATASRELTRAVIEIAKEGEVPFSLSVEADDYGTNCAMLSLTESGVPALTLSVPLGNMHTYSETVEKSDLESAALLVSKVLCDERIIVG